MVVASDTVPAAEAVLVVPRPITPEQRERVTDETPGPAMAEPETPRPSTPPSRRETAVPVPAVAQRSGRVRSGMALVVMIAFLGTLVALAVGAAVAVAAQALRYAVG